ncbi:MAG: CrcB family protein, partial [Gammaproteobacteria bacterium]|nr:CrcB family protein [Gammaproteobacteria bacterium]NNJ73471.1 fluoride efflux transporter CrcB [Enterobacterales bacterium]
MTITANLLMAIAAGGALGAVSRFLIQHITTLWFGITFPWGTMLVNVLGCLSIGM